MAIRLETSKGAGIENDQEFEISAFHLNWIAQIPKLYPNVTPRTEMSPLYNCHGLTFASRRTRVVKPQAVHQILHDDSWREVEPENLLPGDVVVYFSEEGEANHSGIVVACEHLHLPIICSKWGHAGEYVHQLSDCPSFYGPIKKFYRCRL